MNFEKKNYTALSFWGLKNGKKNFLEANDVNSLLDFLSYIVIDIQNESSQNVQPKFNLVALRRLLYTNQSKKMLSQKEHHGF